MTAGMGCFNAPVPAVASLIYDDGRMKKMKKNKLFGKLILT